VQRAKELHPDVAGAQCHASFARLLAAYSVLADPRSRQLYDASRDGRGPGVLRAAAAAGVKGAAAASYEEVEVGCHPDEQTLKTHSSSSQA
jgi:DnaJ-class molecular chaperone